MYSNIYNPKDGKKYSLMDKRGQLILKNYILYLTGGGKCSYCGMRGYKNG